MSDSAAMPAEISWADFEKVWLVAGTVTRVEAFPEARKPAWKVWVDFGPYGERKTSAQIAHLYAAEDLLGRQIVGALIGKAEQQLAAGAAARAVVASDDPAHPRVRAQRARCAKGPGQPFRAAGAQRRRVGRNRQAEMVAGRPGPIGEDQTGGRIGWLIGGPIGRGFAAVAHDLPLDVRAGSVPQARKAAGMARRLA